MFCFLAKCLEATLVCLAVERKGELKKNLEKVCKITNAVIRTAK